VIDTGHAAGADAVNVGGLTPAGLAAVLSRLRAGCEVAVLAICGLAPGRDPRGHSERLAAQVVAALA
jgi:arginase family enzyme